MNTNRGTHVQRSFGVIALAAALMVISHREAVSQGGVKNVITLQPTTPGTQQSGHGNISGTMRAGQFVGGGAGLTGIAWSSITGTPTSLPPNGTASGDLTGSYPSPFVSRIQGRNVSSSAPLTNNALVWNGTTWIPGSPSVPWSLVTGAPASFPPAGPAGGDLFGTFPNPVVDGLQGLPVSSTVPTNGQVLTWTGTAWAPATSSGFSIPFTSTQNLGTPLFSLTNNGLGDTAWFYNLSATGTTLALRGQVSSSQGTGIYGQGGLYGVYGAVTASGATALYGSSLNVGGFAGRFDGRVRVNGSAADDLFAAVNTSTTPGAAAVTGVTASTGQTVGVKGLSTSPLGVAIYGVSTNPTSWAGYFDGRTFLGGNVGVNTQSPAERFHLVGNLRVDGGDIRSNGIIEFRPDVDLSGDSIIRFLNSSGTERGRWDSNGNLGIGVASAAYDITLGDNDTGFNWGGDGVLNFMNNGLNMATLDPFQFRVGRETTAAVLALGGDTTGEKIRSNRLAGPTQYGLEFMTGNATRMFVAGNGNVGIGTTAPETLLRVNGTCKVNVLEISGSGDVAERFEINGVVKPGMIVEIDPDDPGKLRPSQSPYSKLVAGVVSGANNLRPGVILDPHEDDKNSAVAMSGRVWVYCQGGSQGIRPGDMLVSSTKPGYAMLGSSVTMREGAVIGKAMSKLPKGQAGLVLTLVSLQ